MNKQLTAISEYNVLLIGNPNSGKTSLFNALTGLKHKIANYPGVTVEKKTGLLHYNGDKPIRVHDLPGLYTLVPNSLDDKIASDIILNRSDLLDKVDLIVIVVDASQLRRNLYLATQVAELRIPSVLALNMVDTAESEGIAIDTDELAKQVDMPIIDVVANKGKGVGQLQEKIIEIVENESKPFPETGLQLTNKIHDSIKEISAWLANNSRLTDSASKYEAFRILSSDKALDCWRLQNNRNGHIAPNFEELSSIVKNARDHLSQNGMDSHMLETRLRYDWVDSICQKILRNTKQTESSLSEKADRILTHRLFGPIIFVTIFALIFQAIFSWAEVPMDVIERIVTWVGSLFVTFFPAGILRDLIVEGAITGVGAILVFLPQILFLFFFLSLMEDTGYMARVAFIMDRFMRVAGLSGRSVIPLLSSFACAIPGIMATRTIQNSGDRLITIMIAPFMSCSARLPVYTLMIGAFIPSVAILGVFSLAGLTLLAMYLLGILAAIAGALILGRIAGKKKHTSTFVMELPPYRMPSLRWTFLQMYERAKIFVQDAGKIILAISIVLWFLASFPKESSEQNLPASQKIKQSYIGQIGHLIEPVIKPLGFDWKMGIGLITSFAAREVMVSTLATIYNVEHADETSQSLKESLQNEKDPITGKPVYTPLVAISLMVFFVLACQCMSTVAVVKRETNSWRWPIIMVVYMTALAYIGSLFVFQGGKILGLG